MRLNLNKKRGTLFNKNIQGRIRFFENIVPSRCFFLFFLVICTSDLNCILGILFRYLFDHNEVNKVLQEATPPPQTFITDLGKSQK